MVLKVSLIIILEVLSSVTERITSLPTVVPFCFEDDCYINPENFPKSWMDAQHVCRMYNSTLPIVDNPDRQRSVVAALYNFTLNGTAEVWLGATASDDGSNNWRWLDGSPCNATLVQGSGDYKRSYAFITKIDGALILHASKPYNNYSFICQYSNTGGGVCTNSTGRLAFVENNLCYLKYDDSLKLSWFNARSNCSADGGDLASFTDFSPLHWIPYTNGSWIGLRHSQWNWQNAVSDSSSDVKFTKWSSDQPNDATPTCISIKYDEFPYWKDWNCSLLSLYICQVLNETSLTPEEDPNIVERSTAASLPVETSGPAATVNVPLAIGLGVGLGGAAIIAVIVIVIIVVVRRQHRKSRSIGNSKPIESFINPNIQMNLEKRETEMKEPDAKPPSDDVSTEYATVQESRDLELKLSPTSVNQGPVYADLGFGQGIS